MAKYSNQKMWCSCPSWKRFCAYLKKLDRANFCPFCGSKLCKKEEEPKEERWKTS